MRQRLKSSVVILMGLLTGLGLTALQPTSPEPVPDYEVVHLQVKVPDKLTYSKDKPPGVVNFDHKAHVSRAEAGKGCVVCHHTSTNAKLKTEAPAKCASCHLAKGNAKNPKVKAKELWTREAFHTNCTDCHKQSGKGPAKCTDCHTKAT